MLMITAAMAMALAQLQTGNADVDCILDRLTLADRSSIGREISENGGGRGSGAEALRSAALRCAAERDWDADLAAGMGSIALAMVIGQHAQGVLGAAGISTRTIDSWFNRQSEEVQTNLQAQGAAEQLVIHLASTGVPMDALERHGHSVGVYLGVLIMLKRIERGMPI